MIAGSSCRLQLGSGTTAPVRSRVGAKYPRPPEKLLARVRPDRRSSHSNVFLVDRGFTWPPFIEPDVQMKQTKRWSFEFSYQMLLVSFHLCVLLGLQAAGYSDKIISLSAYN